MRQLSAATVSALAPLRPQAFAPTARRKPDRLGRDMTDAGSRRRSAYAETRCRGRPRAPSSHEAAAGRLAYSDPALPGTHRPTLQYSACASLRVRIVQPGRRACASGLPGRLPPPHCYTPRDRKYSTRTAPADVDGRPRGPKTPLQAAPV